MTSIMAGAFAKKIQPDQIVIVIQTQSRQVELNNAGAKEIQFWLKIVDEI